MLHFCLCTNIVYNKLFCLCISLSKPHPLMPGSLTTDQMQNNISLWWRLNLIFNAERYLCELETSLSLKITLQEHRYKSFVLSGCWWISVAELSWFEMKHFHNKVHDISNIYGSTTHTAHYLFISFAFPNIYHCHCPCHHYCLHQAMPLNGCHQTKGPKRFRF